MNWTLLDYWTKWELEERKKEPMWKFVLFTQALYVLMAAAIFSGLGGLVYYANYACTRF